LDGTEGNTEAVFYSLNNFQIINIQQLGMYVFSPKYIDERVSVVKVDLPESTFVSNDDFVYFTIFLTPEDGLGRIST
jgi:hypothetical protein